MSKKSNWKDRKKRTAERTQERAQNYEAKSSSIITGKHLQDGMEMKWVDKLRKGRDPNRFDFLPFEVTESWLETARSFDGNLTGMRVGDFDYKLEYCIHRNVGAEQATVLCLREMFGKPCAVCEHREYLLQNAEQEDPDGKLANGLKPSWRVLYNVIDLNDPDQEIRLWQYSYHLFEKKLQEEIHLGDEGLRYFFSIDEGEGQTIVWRGGEKSLGKIKFIQADRIDFEEREAYSEEIFDEVYPLDKMIVIPEPEDVSRILLSLPVDGESSNSSSPTKVSGKRPARRRYQEEEQNDDNDNDQSDSNQDDDTCSQGRRFGIDFNQHPECQDCEDQEYDKCQIRAANQSESEKEEIDDEPDNEVDNEHEEGQQEEKEEKPSRRQRNNSKEAPARRRRRR